MTSARIALHGDKGEIEVGGASIAGAITGFTLKGEAGQPPILTAEIALFEAETEADGVIVVVPQVTHDALVALGWTPPKAR